MKSDSAMWASMAVSEHLRRGVPVDEVRDLQLGLALAGLLSYCRWEVDEFWQSQVGVTESAWISVLIVRTVGDVAVEVCDALSPHLDYSLAALRERSWEKMRDLPDAVWRYLSAVTGMSRDEWAALPDLCRQVLGEVVTCPSCARRQLMPDFGKPDELEASDVGPFHAIGTRMWLVFTCPDCGARLQYDVEKRQSTPLRKTMWEKSSMYRWAMFAILVVLVWTAIKVFTNR